MSVLLKKQKLIHANIGLEWADAYDTLQRNWPYTRTRKTPSFVQAAGRMIRRRQWFPLPPRHAYPSTAAYYDALLPLMMAQQRLEQSASWRYVRPLMIRVMLHGWPRIQIS